MTVRRPGRNLNAVGFKSPTAFFFPFSVVAPPCLVEMMTDQVNAATNDKDHWNGPQDDYWHIILPGQFDVHTLTLFMPVSASARVL